MHIVKFLSKLERGLLMLKLLLFHSSGIAFDRLFYKEKKKLLIKTYFPNTYVYVLHIDDPINDHVE